MRTRGSRRLPRGVGRGSPRASEDPPRSSPLPRPLQLCKVPEARAEWGWGGAGRTSVWRWSEPRGKGLGVGLGLRTVSRD